MMREVTLLTLLRVGSSFHATLTVSGRWGFKPLALSPETGESGTTPDSSENGSSDWSDFDSAPTTDWNTESSWNDVDEAVWASSSDEKGNGSQVDSEAEAEQGADDLDLLLALGSEESDFIKQEEKSVRAEALQDEGKLTPAQIAAVTGLDIGVVDDILREKGLTSSAASPAAKGAKNPAKRKADAETRQLDRFAEASNQDNSRAMQSKLGVVDSHQLVELDENGEPLFERFVFVDEHTCIGCTMCATTAQSTFFMEEYNGRARVYEQQGDNDDTIEEAIATCPVNCIHYVPFDELVTLEAERRNQDFNFFTLLHRGDSATCKGGFIGKQSGGGNAPLDISGNKAARCNDCPGRGCKVCPMFSVGENPFYIEREMKKKQKRAARAQKVEQEGAAGKTRTDL